MKEKDSESKIKDDKPDNSFIFSNENVNIGHQPEFDYLKSFALIIMIASHLNVGYSYCYIYKALYNVLFFL